VLKKKWSKRERRILDLVVARALKKEGMLTEPSSGVRIKCWQCVYILHFFEIFLCKLCSQFEALDDYGHAKRRKAHMALDQILDFLRHLSSGHGHVNGCRCGVDVLPVPVSRCGCRHGRANELAVCHIIVLHAAINTVARGPRFNERCRLLLASAPAFAFRKLEHQR